MSCNILYLTSRCNFNCEYCYEHRGRSAAQTIFDLSEEQALKNVEGMIRKDPDDEQTMIVLFGGEPTLNWDVCKKAARHAYKLKKNIFLCLSTNGWKFRNDSFCEDYCRLVRDVNGQISLDLSFDGVGNFKRKLLSGTSTTKGMFQVFRNIQHYGIEYNIRYTVHSGNAEFSAKDLSNIDKYFRPLKYVVSFDATNLPPELLNNAKESIRQYYLDGLIKRPVCELVCDKCQKCAKVGGYSYWAEYGNIRNVAPGENVNGFGDF